MTKTKYYNLQMDDPQDDYDVDVVNANLKKIDEQMKTRENATDALQEPEFTVAAKRENIASKEKMPKILGKIAKFFADLKTVAFSGKYNDLDGKPAIVNNNTTTEPGSALDARQANPNIEGTMAASIAQINSNLLKFQRFTVTTTEIAVNSDSYIKLLYPQSYKELIALIPMFIRPRSHWNSRGTFWNFDGSQINFRVIGLESASAQTFDIEYYWVYK
jgi:hypothetical protein